MLVSDEGNDGSSFWICGDDAQSIYGFTGASVGNILNFGVLFPESQLIILDLNYRSTPEILAACQNLIRHNERQIHKELKTQTPKGEEVFMLESSSEETEALSVVTEIKNLVESQGYRHLEIAVLFRANFQSRTLEEVFIQQKVPYQIQGGVGFYERREVRLLLDYMQVIIDPSSNAADESLLRIINVPNRYLGREFCDNLKQHAQKQQVHLYEALGSMRIVLPYIRKNVIELVRFMDPLIADAENLEPADLIHLLRTALDYDRFITDEDIPSPDDVKIANLNQLQMAATRFTGISAFLEYTETFGDETVCDNKEGVSLMTIHKAKGLEFPVVFVVGCVEGIMPSKRGNLEEERRICFVAMSRAMQLLYLSHSLTYLGQPAKKSLFLDEALGKKEPASSN